MTKKTKFNQTDMQRLAASSEESLKQFGRWHPVLMGWLKEPVRESYESLLKASPHNGVFTYDDVSVFVMALLLDITGSYSEMTKVINMMAAETTLLEPMMNADVSTEQYKKRSAQNDEQE
jgi:hypothetical protein